MSPAGARYAVFLRGMNLGGRRITNEDLCAAVAACGFAGVQAFQAAGNLVLDATARDADAVRARLEKGLRESLGYPVPTFVRSGDELRSIAERRPFAADRLAGAGPKARPQVALLQEPPPPSAGQAVLALATRDDALVLVGRELHWLPEHGVGLSELDWKRIEKIVGPSTVRTQGTLERMVAKFF